MEDDKNIALAASMVSPGYIRQGVESLHARGRLLRTLLSERRAPDEPWRDSDVEYVLGELSGMDSNNFPGHVGLGEREGRVLSDMVRRRSFGLAHGIGRSGDVAAEQPKAAGSSLLVRLTTAMVLDVLKDVCGMRAMRGCVLLPVATGMSLSLTLQAVIGNGEEGVERARKRVVWSRVDQKACFKSILTAGYEPDIVELKVGDDGLTMDLEVFREKLRGAACVFSTTSCFAPRNCDPIVEIAKLCAEGNIPHVINHAYGLQSRRLCNLVEAACREGRVDAVVSSMDKNFLVPVGGGIVFSPNAEVCKKVGAEYAGRGSVSSILDLFITFLTVGKEKYRRLIRERESVYDKLVHALRSKLDDPSSILTPKNNPISIAIRLPLHRPDVTRLGSMLFARGISGARVVPKDAEKAITDKYVFRGWGAHSNAPDSFAPYLTVAAAIGLEEHDIDKATDKIKETIEKWLSE